MPMPTHIETPDFDIAVEEHIEVKEPKFHKVIVHNDDKTTVDFVILLLQQVFHLPSQKAVEITLAIHHEGFGVVGVYSQEVAEDKVNDAMSLASKHGFPLKTTSEEE